MERPEEQNSTTPPTRAEPEPPKEPPKKSGRGYAKPSISRHGNLRLMTQLE